MRLELFTDFEELVTGLQRPEVDPAAVVLVIGSRMELDEFLPLRPILQNTRVIQVLPDQAKDTLNLAEQLHPYSTSNLPGMTLWNWRTSLTRSWKNGVSRR